MRIVLMGSGELACPALERLCGREGDLVAAVVTQPDRPGGRRLRPTAVAAKRLAEQRGLPVLTPGRVSDPVFARQLAGLAPDVVVVAAYGQFLRRNVLDVPRLATVNVHPSLLPKYRGAAPVQWAVARGDSVTGVTILHVTEAMDAGDIILQEEEPIRPDDTAESLAARLAERGAVLLDRSLDALAAGTAPRAPQDPAQVVLAPKLCKEDGRIDWSRPAADIHNRVRGFRPWPGCHAEWPAGSGRRVKILSAAVETGSGAPGEILAAGRDGLLVAAGRDALRLASVQPEGRPAMSGGAFCCGYRPKPGDRLG